MPEPDWVLEHSHSLTGCPACKARMEEEEEVGPNGPPPGAIICAMCLMKMLRSGAEEDRARLSVTILDGMAVCDVHLMDAMEKAAGIRSRPS